MGWWPSFSTPANSKSDLHPSSAPSPDASPSNPASNPNADDELHAAYPHLAPTTPPPSSLPKQSPTLSPEYPTTMSCRAAFDSAFYCASIGGHFNDIYRYGELRSCSEHWADWRFCMGLKMWPRAEKEKLIQDRYQEKEERVRQGPNSEHVWKRRAEGERDYGAFRPMQEEKEDGTS